MKTILIVLDGMADRPVPRLGDETPLESADTPTMDYLARIGSCGMIDILGGIAPESDAAVLSLLGYEPKKYYTGRGPLEAVGIGMKMQPGTLALRCNFATSSNGIDLVDRRVGRTLTSRESAEIAAVISRNVKLKNASFVFSPGVAHRAVLAIKAATPLSSRITNTDPAYAVGKGGIPEALSSFEMKVESAKPLENNAKLSAELVNDFTSQCYDILKNHPLNKKRVRKGLLPANVIISRDAGNRLPELYSLSRQFRRRFAILADMPLEIGIGKMAGMGIVKLPLPTFKKEDHTLRVAKTLSALKRYDSLYIHIKGPDLYGHEGDFIGKRNCITDIDRYFIGPLLKNANLEKTVIAITSDHSTPCILKGHSGDPVPFLLSGGMVPKDEVNAFSERKCISGSYGKLKAVEFMPLIMRNS